MSAVDRTGMIGAVMQAAEMRDCRCHAVSSSLPEFTVTSDAAAAICEISVCMQVMQVTKMTQPRFITVEEVDGFLFKRMANDRRAAAKDKKQVRTAMVGLIAGRLKFSLRLS